MAKEADYGSLAEIDLLRDLGGRGRAGEGDGIPEVELVKDIEDVLVVDGLLYEASVTYILT
jgi:hypothetical protein